MSNLTANFEAAVASSMPSTNNPAQAITLTKNQASAIWWDVPNGTLGTA
jgi:hypothetical protein